jgi:uncharacterized protein
VARRARAAGNRGGGFTSGLVGGATALPGPPVILYYMASPLPVAQVRANLMMFLVMVDLGMVGAAGGDRAAVLALVMVSACCWYPFSLANAVGSALFRPERAAPTRRCPGR